MEKLDELKKALKKELHNILKYWQDQTIDHDNGGFIGHIDYPNIKRTKSNKGIILNSRILWSFSAASNYYKDQRYEHICKRSYEYLRSFFNDQKHKGLFWELDYKGNPVNKKKQIYAQSFAIYALSEYYLFSKNEEAKRWAIELFDLIERYALDKKYGGYIEAFSEEWNPLQDMRLSEKDSNEAKTMNTHLHILEAYTTFYKIYPEEKVLKSLKSLVHLFLNKFLQKDGHVNLFFDEKWSLKSSIYSYGHDIEASWLLIEAAKAIGDKKLLNVVERKAMLITNCFIKEAIDKDGGVMNEINIKTKHKDTDRHWWQQAEAIVGLYYGYKLTKKQKYIDVAFKIWEFTRDKIIDKNFGEWFWLIDKEGNYNPENEKVGMWKCPYHNSRACIQINL